MSWSPAVDFDAPDRLEALRRREEDAFVALYERFHECMVRIARAYVRSQETAKEVVQDAWLGVARGIEGFEGRSALKTWIFRIVINRARTRAARDGRDVAFNSIEHPADEPDPSVSWFVKAPDARADKWAAPLRTWERDPESLALDRELAERLVRAIDSLPPVQQLVLTLRDVEGLSSQEVLNLVGIVPGNQRVLLHRARLRIRTLLSNYLAE